MSFHRTASGLSAQRHFTTSPGKKDVTVYIEGSSDIRFWEKIFGEHRPDVRPIFKQKMGANNLKSVAALISSGKAKNCIICRDSDYLSVEGQTIHRNLIYTHGYSFENDIITIETAVETIKSLTSEPVNDNKLRRQFSAYFYRFALKADKAIALDMAYHTQCDPIIAKSPVTASMLEAPSGLLYLDTTQIKRRVRDNCANLKRNKSVPSAGHFPDRFCGHKLFFAFCKFCKIISRRLEGKNTPGINHDVLKRILIGNYDRYARQEIKRHYDTSLARITFS